MAAAGGRAARRPQARALCAAAVGALALHALLLPSRLPRPAAPERPAGVVAAWRWVAAPSPATVPQPPAPRPALPRREAPAVHAAPLPGASAAPVEDTAAPAASPPAERLPTYPTRLPAEDGEWPFSWRQGAAAGTGTLGWTLDREAGRYRAWLRADAAGRPWLDWHSEGALDAHGFAPERFVDRRRGRAAQAASLLREDGVIRYSGAANQQPLPAGTQDRLSLLLQLPAILAASTLPPAELRLWVSGARGDAELWRFDVQADAQGALLLQRQARTARGLAAEAAFDGGSPPQPRHWRFVPVAGGDAFEMLFEAAPAGTPDHR